MNDQFHALAQCLLASCQLGRINSPYSEYTYFSLSNFRAIGTIEFYPPVWFEFAERHVLMAFPSECPVRTGFGGVDVDGGKRLRGRDSSQLRVVGENFPAMHTTKPLVFTGVQRTRLREASTSASPKTKTAAGVSISMLTLIIVFDIRGG